MQSRGFLSDRLVLRAMTSLGALAIVTGHRRCSRLAGPTSTATSTTGSTPTIFSWKRPLTFAFRSPAPFTASRTSGSSARPPWAAVGTCIGRRRHPTDRAHRPSLAGRDARQLRRRHRRHDDQPVAGSRPRRSTPVSGILYEKPWPDFSRQAGLVFRSRWIRCASVRGERVVGLSQASRPDRDGDADAPLWRVHVDHGRRHCRRRLDVVRGLGDKRASPRRRESPPLHGDPNASPHVRSSSFLLESNLEIQAHGMRSSGASSA